MPFVTVGVANADGIVRLESFGPLEGPRLGVNAVCLLASVGKPMVATAILREVEAGGWTWSSRCPPRCRASTVPT